MAGEVRGAPAFLRAEWRLLAMLNYEVEAATLHPMVPAGTELDSFEGRHYVSIVGFQFLRTRVLGVGVPFHRDFVEVNLRFYVRRRADQGWRRGVVFVKELVPRRAIAWVARALYGENYMAMPMLSQVESDADRQRVRYEWGPAIERDFLEVEIEGSSVAASHGSEAWFITDHEWGYSRRNGETLEYQVVHPAWNVGTARRAQLQCRVAALYGDRFAPFLRGTPRSAFLADGSAVTVYRPRAIPSPGETP